MEFTRFDVSTKELIWDDPPGWLDRLGIGAGGVVEVVDSDITTLSASADKVIRVASAAAYLVNIELQSSHDTGLTRTLWFRQVALDYRHDLPVLTVLVLLRKEADSPSLAGVYERSMPNGRLRNRHDYKMVRLWREHVEPCLSAGVGLVPLAPLTNMRPADLPDVVRRLSHRINCEPAPQAAKLWTATYLLMGLRYPDELTHQLLEGVQSMQDSTNHQEILRDGRMEDLKGGRIAEAHRLLLRQGTKRLGNPRRRPWPRSKRFRTLIASKSSRTASSTRTSAVGTTCSLRDSQRHSKSLRWVAPLPVGDPSYKMAPKRPRGAR